jgi:hypothetical protein
LVAAVDDKPWQLHAERAGGVLSGSGISSGIYGSGSRPTGVYGRGSLFD